MRGAQPCLPQQCTQFHPSLWTLEASQVSLGAILRDVGDFGAQEDAASPCQLAPGQWSALGHVGGRPSVRLLSPSDAPWRKSSSLQTVFFIRLLGPVGVRASSALRESSGFESVGLGG